MAADSDIARNLQKQEEADRLEKEKVKKLTLEMNERQEEEDLHDAIATVRQSFKDLDLWLLKCWDVKAKADFETQNRLLFAG